MHILEIAARWAWETSIAASILILPLLAAGLLLRKPVFTPVRHMLGLLVVARLLLPFSVSSPFSVFNWARPAEAIPVSLLTIVERAPALAPAVTAEAPAVRAAIRENRHVSWSTVLPLLWAIGVLLILARVLRQHLKVRKWVQNSTTITNGPAAEALQAALALSECKRRVGIFSVMGLPTPALFGLLRPTILLPEEFVLAGDFERLRMVCLHEIAHLHRNDVLINGLKILAQALHWFNPLVWFAMRRLRADQELLCDGDVMHVLRPEDRHSYGETLLALASPRNSALSTLIPVSSNFKQLKERIGMIRQFKSAKNRLLIFALPPLAAALAIFTFTAAAEKRQAQKPIGDEKASPSEVSREDKARRGIKILEMEAAIETDRILAMERDVDQLRKALKISFGEESELHAETAETMRKLQADRIGAEQECEQLERVLKEMTAKKGRELRYAIPSAYREEGLNRLVEKLETAEQEIVTAKLNYGEAHPDVRKAAALIKVLNEQIDARIQGIVEGLGSSVSAKKARIDSLNRLTEEAVRRDIEGLENARSYFRARRDLEARQRIRESIYLRLAQERIDSEVGR